MVLKLVTLFHGFSKVEEGYWRSDSKKDKEDKVAGFPAQYVTAKIIWTKSWGQCGIWCIQVDESSVAQAQWGKVYFQIVFQSVRLFN